MAAQFYMSITTSADDFKDVDNSGVASTAGDFLELRIGNGTYTPDRGEVLKGLLRFHRWVMQGGLNQAGANLPQPTGPN